MGAVRIAVREPDKAYVDNMLWLPKAGVREKAVKDALQFLVVGEKGMAETRKLWDETDRHIICPREFIDASTYPSYPFPFIDVRPRKFPKVNIGSKIEAWRDPSQLKARAALSQAANGILNLGTGKGKTVLALDRVAETKSPALIVVHNTYLLEQWHERISKFIELPIGEKIGIIQGPTFDWKRPITIAMIHTLADRVDSERLPSAFSHWFGTAIFDEVHHLAAEHFVKAAPSVYGRRYGLTATAKRIDGTEFVYNYHIGQVFYHDLTTDLTPLVYFQQTPVEIDLEKPANPEDVLDVRGEVNIPKLRSYLGRFEPSLKFRLSCILEAMQEGRKILCIGHSKDMLRNLHEKTPNSGLCISETPQSERNEIVRRSRVAYVIDELGNEGLDDDDLDTVFFLTPFGSPNDLQQGLGRILRQKQGKRQPVAVIFDDYKVRPFAGLCHKLRKVMNGWQLKHTTLKVP